MLLRPRLPDVKGWPVGPNWLERLAPPLRQWNHQTLLNVLAPTWKLMFGPTNEPLSTITFLLSQSDCCIKL
jgi:hypothetical protein